MARSFNGSPDYLSSGIPVDLSGTNVCTVAFWLFEPVFPPVNDALICEFSPNTNTNDGSFYINANDAGDTGNMSAATGNAGAPNTNTWLPPTAAAWHQYTIVIKRTGTALVWIDGVSQTVTNSGTAQATNFGKYQMFLMSRNGATIFNVGSLCEFAVWNIALTGANASSLAAGAAADTISSSNLVSYLHLCGFASPETDTPLGAGWRVRGTSQIAGPAGIPACNPVTSGFVHVQGTVVSGASGTSFSAVLGANPKLGNLVVVAFLAVVATGTTFSIKDSNGNVYTMSPRSPTLDHLGDGYEGIAYLLSAPANASATITITMSNSTSGGGEAFADEFAYFGGTPAFDVDAFGSAVSAANLNTPTLTPNFPNELVYIYCSVDTGVASFSSPWIGGGVDAANPVGGVAPDGDAAAYIIKDSGPATPNFPFSSSGGWDSVVGSFYLSTTTVSEDFSSPPQVVTQARSRTTVFS